MMFVDHDMLDILRIGKYDEEQNDSVKAPPKEENKSSSFLS